MKQRSASTDHAPIGPEAIPTSPGLRLEDSLTEAGRKVLGYHYQRMLRHEPGTRLGADSEELHDMRVATRRMRSAMRIFAPYFDDAVLRPLTKRLRRTGRALGPVRDLDVLIERTNGDLAGLPADERADLEPLLAEWQAQRQDARCAMLAYLDGKRYRKFVAGFGQFLSADLAAIEPGEAARLPVPRVRSAVPALIGNMHEDLIAHEPVADEQSLDALHELRIECKRFRYTLEFFRELLGPQTGKVIREVVAVQDHLGALVDARVAVRLLQDFLAQRTDRTDSSEREPRGVRRYLAAKQGEMAARLRDFPGVWGNFRRPEVGQLLTRAIAAWHVADDVP